jgi:hypothetical protein
MNRLTFTLLLATACLGLGPDALAEDRLVEFGGLPEATDVVATTIMDFTPSESGDRLVGDFDLGVKFSLISSVRLELMIPEGYEGAAVFTGNSSYGRSLDVVRHAASETIEFTDIGPQLPINSLSGNFFHIEPNESGELRLGSIFGPNGAPNWLLTLGDFLTSGRGRVTLTEVERFASYSLVDDVPGTHRTLYAAPAVNLQARITITGAAIPEPSVAATLAAATCLPLLRPRRRTVA